MTPAAIANPTSGNLPVAQPRILIIEDERGMVQSLTWHFNREGFETHVAADGPEGLRKAQTLLPDVILLDLMLPGMKGVDVCRELRAGEKTRDIPIIMMTALSDESDQLVGFSVGADDYVTKPFGMDELLARLRAVQRRRVPAEEEPVVETPHFRLDLADKRVTGPDGAEVHLTPTEWHFLEVLVRHPGKLVSQRQLLQEVWGPEYRDETNYLRVFMANLRRKLEPDPSRPRYLLTEPGMGYRFAPPG